MVEISKNKLSADGREFNLGIDNTAFFPKSIQH
jgi:hypothetical protein